MKKSDFPGLSAQFTRQLIEAQGLGVQGDTTSKAGFRRRRHGFQSQDAVTNGASHVKGYIFPSFR